MRLAAVCLLALGLLAAPAGMAGAQSNDEQSEVRTSDTSVTVEYSRSVDGVALTERITFDTNATTFGVQLERANQTGGQTNELNTQLHQVAEYEDENENGRYDADEPLVSSYTLSERSENVLGAPENGTVRWGNLTSSETQSDDGKTGTVVRGEGRIVGSGNPTGPVREVVGEAQNRSIGENRTFAVSLYVFDSPATVNGTEVQPGQVKIDLEIENYPYARNGTSLALALQPRSELGLQNASQASEGVEAQDTIEDVDANLLYTWNQTANVDGTDQPVGTTRLQGNASDGGSSGNETERLYALGYERGQSIVHDPVTGIRLVGAQGVVDRAQDRASETPGLGIWAALSTLGIAAAAARRRA